MPASDIVIKGAREHNLQSVDLKLPRNKLICLTGVSGSGKSSLAFDTLYAEGQRRYVESLSSFARQFLGQMPKPDVDFIGGLSPSISISQKSTGNNPRSTVGTITEIYDFLRVLYARVGTGYCPRCEREITAQTREQILARILQQDPGTRFLLLAPVIRGQKGEYRDLFDDLLKQGFVRARVDGQVVSLNDDLQLDRRMRHDIEVVIDRLVMKPDLRVRLADSVEMALNVGQGNLIVAVESSLPPGDEADQEQPTALHDTILSVDYACTSCGISFQPPSPQLFSFNSPHGMCLSCDGLGETYSFDPDLLIPDPSQSFKKGCIELIGRWTDLGRWRRHIYQGVADTVERIEGLEPGTMLNTPWNQLDPRWQRAWLWGTGDQHITFTWRGGSKPMKYGGRFEGIIPDLSTKYRNSKSRMQIAQLAKYMRTIRCGECDAQRLNRQARSVRIRTVHPQFADQSSLSLPDVCHLSVADAAQFFEQLELDETRALIATEVLKEIRGRLGFLRNVGLDYLALDRTAPTLSGGESQRIRLAGQIGSGLVGVLYILDEPSIGLHPRDNDRLLATLAQLRDMGNTVVVVEHDEETMRAADHLIDFGPGPGVRGGEVVACGTARQIMKQPRSVTGQYLAGKRRIDTPSERRPVVDEPANRTPSDSVQKKDTVPKKDKLPKKAKKKDSKTDGLADQPTNTEQQPQRYLVVRGATHNNLRDVDVQIPLGRFVCVTGVSGSGKSSLVNDILVEALRRDLNKGNGEPGPHQAIEGLEHLDKLIAIDQSPIGRTPRSNPGTYIKVFDDIRRLFTQLPESKRRGYQPGRFSFNVDGGRCQACDGNGSNRLEMDFLADVWVTCPVCEGHRYNRETLQVRFKEQSIADVLEMDIQQAMELFENIPKVQHKLQTLHDVGLDYLKLGQPSPTLSGGEAQRIKLARELVKKSTGQTLYLLDEPTTGLHFADIQLLLDVLHNFVDAGNTVLVVEHNLDVVKTADWIIDLGPEGGVGGGLVVASGTPEQIAENPDSHTGRALRPVLGMSPAKPKPKSNGETRKRPAKPSAASTRRITVQGARQHNLKGIDAKINRDQMTVFCGPSGSGKSSLAMDTIYAEGQRRYVESLSAYARQFVGQMQKPRLDHIDGLSPAIAIEQKNLGHSPRSTVGTVTEIYDYFRILLARLGTPHCPDCDTPVGTQTSDQIVDKIMAIPEGTRLYLMAPIEVTVGQSYENLWEELRAAGYIRARVDGATISLDDPPKIDRRRKHQVEVIVDRAVVRAGSRGRIADSAENGLALGKGVLHVANVREDVAEKRWKVEVHSQHLACEQCGRSLQPLTPHNFSFNSQLGWCNECEGLGTQTGANPAALLRDPKLSLADGAVALWPDLSQPVARLMLHALARGTGISLDQPFDQLPARERRIVLHGTGDRWFEVLPPGAGTGKPKSTKAARSKRGKATKTPLFRFQFKGLYPALEEASRLSPLLRSRLEHLVDEVECSACSGSRLRDDASAVQFQRRTIDELCRLPLGELLSTVRGWKLTQRDRRIAGEVLREIDNRLEFLNDVGLDYLSLSRGAATLSNGEAQRIRLASQLGSGLCGVLYVLDEPTIGLHPRDNRRLLSALHKLRDLGNTLLVVEHDHEVIAGSDYVCDFGPAAGRHGGQIVAEGTPAQLGHRRKSVTGPYLTGKKHLPIPSNRRVQKAVAKRKTKVAPPIDDPAALQHWQPPGGGWLEVVGARHHNLRNVDVAIPLGTLTAVTGPSGSGKSSLVDDVLHAALSRKLHRAKAVPGAHDEILGIEYINKVIRVDQQPLGNSPTSNPATYTGVFELIRILFAQLPQAKLRGYTPRRFSFNAAGGRCEACEGNGQLCIEMHFLPDVWVTCDTCDGKRYNPETLAVQFHGHSISDVLDMTCGDAVDLFANIPKVRRILQTLCDVGLDYLTLGQPAPTLSGGEAQRVKLGAELARPDTGQTLYLLDEPTTGLHFDDLARLLEVLHRLVDLGNTVVVIEHNMDVVKNADWVIDMGPEAGDLGGRVVARGTPEMIVESAERAEANDGKRPRANGKPAANTSGDSKLHRSHTGEALRPILAAGPYQPRTAYDPHAESPKKLGEMDITEVGREARMPWEQDGRTWHTRTRVDRKGEPCQWDGDALAQVIDQIQELGDFHPTDWNARTVVEIAATQKTKGWFLHALTGETWLLKLRFRVPRGTFKAADLDRQLGLKTLNEIEDLPVYGNEARVRCKQKSGAQEVQISVSQRAEIETPAFADFLEQAVAAFCKKAKRQTSVEDAMPWKKLGQKWHFLRKGFPTGKKVRWDEAVLEQLHRLLVDVAPKGHAFEWKNQQLVHLFLPGRREPWASLQTKRPDALRLMLTSPKGMVALGRITELAWRREVDGEKTGRDVVKLAFRTAADLRRGDLREFLEEHLQGVLQANGDADSISLAGQEAS